MKVLLFLFTITVTFSVYAQDDVHVTNIRKSSTDENSYFVSNGAWCWFSDPRAVYYEGNFKRTYAGWVTSEGDIMAGYYDHSSKSVMMQVLMKKFEKDDHDNPALLFRPDGRLIFFFTKHGGANPTYMCTMDMPEDISSWEMQELYLNDTLYYKGFNDENTYVNPVMLSEENNRIYLFWRGIDNKPNYSFSDDLGTTWSKGRIFILPERIYSMRRPYVKVESNGRDKIVFAFTDGHPNMEKENSIYVMVYQKGALYNVEGKKIGGLGEISVFPRATSVVYDATITKEKSWIWDVAFDGNDNPVVVFARFPDDSNHVYTWGKWDGAKWIVKDLVNSGSWFPSDPVRERNYSGGIVLDHENTNAVYLSVKRETKYEIEKWETKDDGNTWEIKPITRNSAKDNVRPFVVRYANPVNPCRDARHCVSTRILWLENVKYVHYTDYISAIRMHICE